MLDLIGMDSKCCNLWTVCKWLCAQGLVSAVGGRTLLYRALLEDGSLRGDCGVHCCNGGPVQSRHVHCWHRQLQGMCRGLDGNDINKVCIEASCSKTFE